MYAYIAKGITTGHVLARQLLRRIAGAPGFLLDCALALFWMPDVTSYWAEDSAKIKFADGSETTSTFYGILGWIGEITGYVVGSIIGAAVGAILFFPDLVLRATLGLYDKIAQGLNDISEWASKKATEDNNFEAEKNPTDILDKGYNVGMVLIGYPLAAIPYAAFSLVGFFLPVFKELNDVLLSVAGWYGGVAGMILSIPAYFVDRSVDLIKSGRNAIRSAVAFTYALGNEQAEVDGGILPAGTLHEKEFVEEKNQFDKLFDRDAKEVVLQIKQIPDLVIEVPRIEHYEPVVYGYNAAAVMPLFRGPMHESELEGLPGEFPSMDSVKEAIERGLTPAFDSAYPQF